MIIIINSCTQCSSSNKPALTSSAPLDSNTHKWTWVPVISHRLLDNANLPSQWFPATKHTITTSKMQHIPPKISTSITLMHCILAFHEWFTSLMYTMIVCIGISYVEHFIKMGFFFVCFDFSGCGNSEGDGVTFGDREKDDVAVVVEEVWRQYGINSFILWGRSMGAVACVKYCEMLMTNSKPIQIRGIILDSPFKSLKQLIIELGIKRTQMPSPLVHAFYFLIKPSL